MLADRAYGYQIMDRSQQTVLKYLNEQKTHAVFDNNLLMNKITWTMR